MKQRIAVILFIAAFVAACATGFGVRTDHAGDVGSYCDQSISEYEGHRLHCVRLTKQTIRPRCSATELTEAKAVRDKAKAWCASNPQNTPANVAFIKGLVAQQALIGSGK